MEFAQTYETWITTIDGKPESNDDLRFECLVIPERTFQTCNAPLAMTERLAEFEIELGKEVATDEIAKALRALEFAAKRELTGDRVSLAFEQMRGSGDLQPNEFEHYILSSEVIPFESSPLAAASIAGLLTKGGGVGVGAYIGFVIGGGSPLLLITVPAGMIICGIAAGVAWGLQDGLRQRIKGALVANSKKKTKKENESQNSDQQTKTHKRKDDFTKPPPKYKQSGEN